MKSRIAALIVLATLAGCKPSLQRQIQGSSKQVNERIDTLVERINGLENRVSSLEAQTPARH